MTEEKKEVQFLTASNSFGERVNIISGDTTITVDVSDMIEYLKTVMKQQSFLLQIAENTGLPIG